MITIISASNRDGNLTASYSSYCRKILSASSQDFAFYNLADIPDQFSLKSVYDYETSYFEKLAREIIQPADKFLFVIPEYNGSFPGILKLFIDAVHPRYFKGKKAALIGVAAGRAGNLRGMDHFSDILNHLQVHVLPQKLPISKMDAFLEADELVDQETMHSIDEQLKRLIEF